MVATLEGVNTPIPLPAALRLRQPLVPWRVAGEPRTGTLFTGWDLPLKPQTVESAVNRAVRQRLLEFLHAFVGDPRVVSEPQNLELGQP